MYFITYFTYSNKYIYLNTFNIDVAHRYSDNRGPTVYRRYKQTHTTHLTIHTHCCSGISDLLNMFGHTTGHIWVGIQGQQGQIFLPCQHHTTSILWTICEASVQESNKVSLSPVTRHVVFLNIYNYMHVLNWHVYLYMYNCAWKIKYQCVSK